MNPDIEPEPTVEPEYQPNRAERRAAKFKKGLAKPTWGSNRFIGTAALDKAHACRPWTEGETSTAHAITAVAWLALQNGEGGQGDFDRVAYAINLAWVRALEIDATLAADLQAAKDAMTACKQRYEKHGRFGFTGSELQIMRYAMECQTEIVNASSPEQMRRAYRVVLGTIKKHGGGK